MKAILLGFTLIFSLAAMGKTKLQCYETFQSEIETIDTSIISAYRNLIIEEERLLDQYFNPGNYYKGAHVPFKAAAKENLYKTRAQTIKWTERQIETSGALSDKLKKCLNEASN